MTNDSAYQVHATFGNFNYSVDWENDGVFDDSNITSNITHQYLQSGVYTIRIKGTYEALRFGYSQDEDKLISVDQWGSTKWRAFSGGFWGCDSLRQLPTDTPDLSIITDLSALFFDAKSLKGPVNHWNVSHVINMNSTFRGANSFNDSLYNWDVSSVVSMYQMFREAYAFNQDINNWDVSNVRNMEEMFSYANSYDRDLNNWDVSNVENMRGMFSYARAFNKPIGNWDISSDTTLKAMFKYASAFNQNISNWDVSNIVSMKEMLQGCFLFNQPIQTWNVKNVEDMSNMLSFTVSFDQNLAAWNIDSVNNMSGIFDLSGISVKNYDSILMAWQIKPHKKNVSVGARNLKFCLGDSARSLLIADGWSFNGDSLDCTTVSIEDLKIEDYKLKIYPNPSPSNFNLSIKQLQNGERVEIRNVLGEVVYTFRPQPGVNQIDLSAQSQGIYFLRYGELQEKIILNR